MMIVEHNFLKLVKNGYQFKTGEYISKGLDLFKKDMGNFIVAYFFCIILSFIPLCSYMAIGNFYKLCQKVDEGKKGNAGDIFDFTDFFPYLKFQIFLIVLVMLILIPIQIFMLPILMVASQGSENLQVNDFLSYFTGGFFSVIFLVFIIAGLIGAGFHFLMPLISNFKILSVRAAIEASWRIAKKRLFSIFIFVTILYFLSMLGFVFCFIGIFITAPLVLCIKYISAKDILILQNNLQLDELDEIGKITE